MDRIECIYLVGCEANTLVKIGRSVDVQVRLEALRTMSPVALTLLWQTLGGAELEAALHRRFDAQRHHGEWFDFPDGDAVDQVSLALPEIAAEMQRVQREHLARLAQQAKDAKDAAERASRAPSKDTRERARKLLADNPEMQAPELAEALGKARGSGYVRQLRTELLEQMRDSGELPSVRAIGA